MKIVIANWKMHLGIRESLAHARGVLRSMMGHDVLPEVVICPSFTALSEVRKVLVRTRVSLGAQNMGTERFGAFTGDVSLPQLDDAGCSFVMIGHSERRILNGETDAVIQKKMKLITQTSLVPILCVGESASEHAGEKTLDVVTSQLLRALEDVQCTKASRLIIAYEPVWAIGTNVHPTPEEVVRVHAHIRTIVSEKFARFGANISVVYGGSVTGENAYQFLREPEIDGVLVGSASLKIPEFERILYAAKDVLVAQGV